MKQNHLLFGAAYYDEYMPYDRIETDMKLMKEAGMNVIRIAESTWSTWEPQDNVYDFTHLHRMMEASVKYGIDVIIGTPTYAIPAWLAKKYPKILALTKNGQELYGRRQITDITNPDYRRHAERMIRRLMEEVKDYPNIIGYQLDNETRAAGAACPETQALFVARLKEKYPDIEDFNHEFGLDYWSNRIGSWEDFPDIRGTINGSLSAAYKRFLRDCITEFLQWQAAIMEDYRKPGQFLTHNFDFGWHGYSYGIQPEVNQFDAAGCLDIAGVDIYHLSQEKLTGAEIAFGGAVGRSLKKDNYFVLETQSQGLHPWLPYPGQLRLQAFSHLASGADSVMYWNWHSIHNSFESYWKGILSHNLEPGATYYELKAFGAEVGPIESKLLHLKVISPAAILVDNGSLTALDEFPICGADGSKVEYNDIVRLMFDACYQMNLACDIVSVNDDFSRYPLLLVPALYAVSEETLRKLDAYTQAGGHMVLGFRSAFADEELKIYPANAPYLLTECIGATYDQFTCPEQVTLRFTENFGTDSTKYPVSHWMELVRPDSAEVWASYRHPYWGSYAAVTHHPYGKGSATYLGCMTTVPAVQAILRKLCGIAKLPLPEYAFPLIAKSGVNEAGHLITYFFNYSSHPISFVYDGKAGIDLLDGAAIQTGETKEIPAWDLMIVEA